MFVLQKILATNDSSVPNEAFPPPAEIRPWQLTSSSHLKIPTPSTTKTTSSQSQMESTSVFFQGFWLCILGCCAQSLAHDVLYNLKVMILDTSLSFYKVARDVFLLYPPPHKV